MWQWGHAWLYILKGGFANMKIKRFFSVIAAGALMTSLLAGCTSGGKGSQEIQKSNVIKLGGIVPTTGKVAVYGQAVKNGVTLAVEQYNAEQGVLGKQIEYISYDDKGDVTEAVNAFKKLVSNDKVDAIVGAVTSSPTLAITPLAAKDNIPMITPTATALDVTTAGDNIFRACFTDPYQGKLAGEFSKDELKASTAAILYNTADDYSTGLAAAFKEAFEAKGGKVVNYEGYNADDKDFKSILTNVKANNPDVLFLPDYYNTVALISKQVKEVGITATLVGGDGWDGVLTVEKEGVEGAYFINHYATDDQAKEVQDFIKAYKAKYNEDPNAFAALGYDAAVVMLESIKKAGSTDKKAVIQALKEADVTSVTGRITFDAKRNPVKSVSVIRIQGGQNKLFKKMNP